ncbi:unannotated protein [freshwater metagenome]
MSGERAVGRRVCARYAHNLMSTRKLILLALACGLAILAAAAAQLFLATR